MLHQGRPAPHRGHVRSSFSLPSHLHPLLRRPPPLPPLPRSGSCLLRLIQPLPRLPRCLNCQPITVIRDLRSSTDLQALLVLHPRNSSSRSQNTISIITKHTFIIISLLHQRTAQQLTDRLRAQHRRQEIYSLSGLICDGSLSPQSHLRHLPHLHPLSMWTP